MRYTSKMNKQRKSYKWDIDKLHDSIDIRTVAECLGLEIRKIGRKDSILCPLHSDEHFGSCYLYDQNWYCFSCGKHGDAIELVRAVENYNFNEACAYLSSLYGSTKEFFLTEGDQYSYKHILSKDKLNLIFLHPNNQSVRRDVYASYEPIDHDDLQVGQRIRWEANYDDEPGSSKPTGCYVVEEIVMRSPLQDLLHTDELAYNQLIYTKAIEAKEKWREMLEMAKTPIQFYPFEKISDIVKVYYIKKVVKDVGISTFMKLTGDLIQILLFYEIYKRKRK